MSGLGATQKKLTDLAHKVPGADPDATLGINALPHNAQYEEQKKQDKNARDLADQQAADAAAAAEGAKPMAVRDQLYGPSTGADQVTASGNETDLAGTPLGGARRRAARRVLVG